MKNWLIAGGFIAALMGFAVFIGAQGSHHAPPKSPVATGACTSTAPAFDTWLDGQSSIYDEDLRDRYGVQNVSAVCGDVTVSTLISEDSPNLAEAACNTLSGAVGQVAGVESVTVTYGTGKNACFQWPGGPSNF